MRTTLLLLLLIPAVASAQNPRVGLPASIQGTVGQLIPVAAVSTGKLVRWKVATPGLVMVPPEQLANPLVALVYAIQPGTYHLLCWTAQGDVPSDAADVTIVITPAKAILPPKPPTMQPAPATRRPRVGEIVGLAPCLTVPQMLQQIDAKQRGWGTPDP